MDQWLFQLLLTVHLNLKPPSVFLITLVQISKEYRNAHQISMELNYNRVSFEGIFDQRAAHIVERLHLSRIQTLIHCNLVL